MQGDLWSVSLKIRDQARVPNLFPKNHDMFLSDLYKICDIRPWKEFCQPSNITQTFYLCHTGTQVVLLLWIPSPHPCDVMSSLVNALKSVSRFKI